MPIKFPKGLQRRKQSGNLEEEVASQQSSFRVIQRPQSSGNAFDGGARRVTEPRPEVPRKDRTNSHDDDPYSARVFDSSRGSGGTGGSSLNAPYDSGASSARLSTSSTNPSSIDTRSDLNVHHSSQKPIEDVPPIPPHGDKPRTLRTTRRKTVETILPPASNRDRSITESTASTTVPPQLGQGLDLDDSLDSFGNMFDNIRFSRDMSGLMKCAAPGGFPSSPLSAERVEPLRPNKLAPHSEQVLSSPYSYKSHDSLMTSSSPPATVTSSNVQSHNDPESSPKAASIPDRQITTPVPTGRSQTPPQQLTKSPTSHMSPTSPVLDSHLIANAELAVRYQETKSPPRKAPSTNKVMTPAQFENYKWRKEEDRRRGIKTASDDDDSDDSIDYDDDEDEADLARKAAEKKRQQEANLAVYRQQMKRMTGVPSASGSRPASSLDLPTPRAAGFSTADPLNRLSHLTLDSKSSLGGPGKSSAEEDDEDVPLGILAAHGFPNKNRPPTRMSTSPSNPNLRASGAPASVAGDRRESLPVFARKLPQDPYIGAGLVNPSHRESLAMHANHSAPSLVAAPTTVPVTGPYPVHPSGLVGVIAGEERARALRRGSPNALGTYDVPGNVSTPTTYPGAMPGMLTPGDQAQIHMQQQMQHFMQVQMQMMQQMMHMNQGQSMPQPNFPMPGLPMSGQNMPGHPPLGRSQTMMPLSNQSQRTMSMFGPPGQGPWANSAPNLPQITIGNTAYAPSLAPSERSNIGLASRYRPVSTALEAERPSSQRASTFTASTSRPWSQLEPHSRPPVTAAATAPQVVSRKPLAKPKSRADEDDDEAGWAEMKAKKDQKSRTWKSRKDTNALRELYNGSIG